MASLPHRQSSDQSFLPPASVMQTVYVGMHVEQLGGQYHEVGVSQLRLVQSKYICILFDQSAKYGSVVSLEIQCGAHSESCLHALCWHSI